MGRASRLLEEIVERFARTGRRRRFGFALDGSARFKERAGIASIFRRHSNGNRLLTIERRPGIEVHALGAAVEIGAAPGTLAFLGPCQSNRQLAATAPAANDFTKTRHVEGFWRRRRLPARRVFLLFSRLVFGTG